MKESYDVAVALHMHDPIPTMVEAINIGRRPNARAIGTQRRFENPSTRIQMPI